jgi:hypothetical protein
MVTAELLYRMRAILLPRGSCSIVFDIGTVCVTRRTKHASIFELPGIFF